MTIYKYDNLNGIWYIKKCKYYKLEVFSEICQFLGGGFYITLLTNDEVLEGKMVVFIEALKF